MERSVGALHFFVLGVESDKSDESDETDVSDETIRCRGADETTSGRTDEQTK